MTSPPNTSPGKMRAFDHIIAALRNEPIALVSRASSGTLDDSEALDVKSTSERSARQGTSSEVWIVEDMESSRTSGPLHETDVIAAYESTLDPAAIGQISDMFRASGAAVLAEYRGLTVKQITDLRNSLRGNATFAVVKNALIELAAEDAGVTAFDGQLVGPSAIAFVDGDPVEAAKGLRDFAKANPLLVIKAGVLDGRALTPAEITKLADLESREVLLARFASAMRSVLARAGDAAPPGEAAPHSVHEAGADKRRSYSA